MRQTETVTLHFDLGHLSHLPADEEFVLKALGQHSVLKRHDAGTRRLHAQRNSALAVLPERQLQRLTHFAEDVEVPADAVGFHWVGYRSSNPEAVTDEIAVVFQHVPSAAVRRTVRAMRSSGSLRAPGVLRRYGAAHLPDGTDVEQLHIDASNTVSTYQTALTMIMQHPEIGTLVPELHSRITEELIVQEPTFNDLVEYLARSEHQADGDEPWYENTYVRDPAGKVMEPAPGLKDKDGKEVNWPTRTINNETVRVIPQHRLSDDLSSVLKPAVQAVVMLVKQQPWLKGQQWSTQHGRTQLSRTNVAPALALQPRALRAGATARADLAGQADWTIVNQSSHYGLDVFTDSLTFDNASQTLSFDVKNWPNRGLGVYVQFLDENGNPISNPAGWQDRLSGSVRDWLEPNKSKWYLQHIGAGSVIFGGPVWAPRTTISFVLPGEASGVNVLIGGLGNGDWDMDVDKVGLIYTCVVSYGIPALLSLFSVGVQSTAWYTDFFKETEAVVALIAVSMGPFGALLAVGSETIGVNTTLIKTAEFVAGIIWSKALKSAVLGAETFAVEVMEYLTGQQLLDNVPVAGWALRIASEACAIADMIATSAEVGLSPATYRLQLKRSMKLNVTVSPDPTHGTKTQNPIWPEVSHHYVIMVHYKGGTTLTKAGAMPDSDASINVSYSTETGDPLPSAPGQLFQVTASIYSESNWLCGKWTSGWIEAVPTDGDSRSEAGSIIEQLVPLTASTEYSQGSVLDYDTAGKAYVWNWTAFSISADLESLFTPGPVPQPVRDAFLSHGVRLSAGTSIGAGPDAGSWHVVDQDMATSYEVKERAIVAEGKTLGRVLSVRNISNPAPSGTVQNLADQDVQELVDITINDLAYKLGYCYLAQNQNLPEDYGTTDQSSHMFLFESISTLAHPGAGMLVPTRGFSVQPYVAYDQFGPAGLFSFQPAEAYQTELDNGGAVPANISAMFQGQGLALGAGAQVTVVTRDAAWQIGYPGQTAAYDLRRQLDVITVFIAPAPEFSPNNFYLDTRTYQDDGAAHLRRVELQDGSSTTFDYESSKSWGAFDIEDIAALAVHPNGFVIAISFQYDKMAILKLPPEAVDDKDAPHALPFSGTGLREGLMSGPVGMTITDDGRILILERYNARIQAFDTQANPVQCFAGLHEFTLSGDLAGEFNDGTASTALLQALQQNIPVINPDPAAYDPRFLLTPVFSMPKESASGESRPDALDAGEVTQDLRGCFKSNALTFGDGATVLKTAEGLWLLQDISGVSYDLRLNGEGQGEVDVYRCFTPTVIVKAPNQEWTIMDRTNTLSFDVTSQATAPSELRVKSLTSLMRLKDGPSSNVTYLDVATETKGFIYVLSYEGDGTAPEDYRLDLYGPDGTPLDASQANHNGQLNGARMTVDQWRTVFTLNYEQMSGPAGRPEPTVSQWLPSTPLS
jgi:hypothetical protein